jgi:hypothetical protein
MRSFLVCLGVLTWVPSTGLAGEVEQPVEFNRDIRPLLSDACFSCHGPDKAKRKADLRFDTEEGARVDLGGHFALVPGKPQESTMLQRIQAKDPAKRMPPVSAGPGLKAEQVELLRRWIAQGAKWQNHWSFLAPQRAALPEVKNKAWPRNPLDYFVLARLEKERLSPSREADRATLLRRVTLDLTGLPPTSREMDAFLADKATDAYEKVVDRLLASPRFGERMAKPWLDAARYADTNGYQTDGERIMWRWRDWVIEAFNNNMPFDQFTVEQIAGDMLPGATLEQKIATAFNRNHRGNSEGGIIPEEYAVEYVVDRVDTTATVWLGLTAGCAKCHTHKYDPITQKEFYQLFAYFNNVPEKGKAIKYGNSPPYLKSPTREQHMRWKLLESQLLAAQMEWRKIQPDLEKAQAKWETETPGNSSSDWRLRRGLLAHFPLDQMPDGPLMATHGSLRILPGKVSQGMFFDGQSYLKAAEVGGFGFFDKFTMAAWIYPSNGQGGSILSRMVDTDRADGYNLVLRDGKIHVHLVKRWLDDAIRVETAKVLTPNQWHHVAFSYDGSRVAAGIKVYFDGVEQKLKVNLDDLNQSFNTKEPFRIGAGGGSRFQGLIDDVVIYDHVLPPDDVALVANSMAIQDLLKVPALRRSPAQAHKLRTYFLEKHAPAEIQQAQERLYRAKKELAKFDETIPTTMVMEEMPRPRDTHILIRGEYDKKGTQVQAGLPKALPGLPPNVPNNRLGFARWLVEPTNPLTARVAVNRFWQLLFGAGIVKTVEDFGSQGDWPSHPELLDWLALEFMAPSFSPGEKTGLNAQPWDAKRLLRTIVTSATYRQSSRVRPELLQKDPENRLLARGARVRLSAEMIRDQALFVSGLLVEKIGGPSVHPYQPAGLVKELHGTEEHQQDHGPNLYRRSMYTFWKRTVPPPTMMTFDAANRETCVVRDSRTNTPLQALNLMNDVTFVEAARVLAQRTLQIEGLTVEERLTYAFRQATCRTPAPAELTILRAGLLQHLEVYRKDSRAAQKLVTMGEYPLPENIDPSELAAYTAVCNLILNLDEVVTKE